MIDDPRAVGSRESLPAYLAAAGSSQAGPGGGTNGGRSGGGGSGIRMGGAGQPRRDSYSSSEVRHEVLSSPGSRRVRAFFSSGILNALNLFCSSSLTLS